MTGHYFVVYRHGTVRYVNYFQDYKKAEVVYMRKKKEDVAHDLKLISGKVEKQT